jgi:hypothetical protein
VAAPLLASCGTGFQAQTNQIYQPGPGISDRTDGVYVLNALVVTDGQGHGTLVGALINQRARPDRLESVTVKSDSGAPLKASILSGTLALLPQRSVQLADTGDVRVSGKLVAGAFCSLSLTFHNAAPVAIQIPIVAKTSAFANVQVGPVPPPSTPSHSNP